MSKKTSRGGVSKNSSSTSAAVSSAQSAQKSSILKSAFAPSRLQLALFASVIQNLESQTLRIHDTRSARLRCDHQTRPGTTITSLDWGYYGAKPQEQLGKKKRKREEDRAEDVVVAYGTSTSEICMFSPTQAKVIGTLSGAHERGIKDFKFNENKHQDAWSVGGDGKLVQWNLANHQPVRTISLPDPSITYLSPPAANSPQILCGSSKPFAIDLGASENFRITSFDSFRSTIRCLYRSGNVDLRPETFLAADSGRYVNVWDFTQKRLIRNLNVGGEIESADFYTPDLETRKMQPQQMLSVVTKDGNIELFLEPFLAPSVINGDLKNKSKGLVKRANAQVKLINRDRNGAAVPVFNASLQGPDLLVVTAQGGVELSFQRIRWQDEMTGDLLFEGVKQVPAIRPVSTLNTVTTNGVKHTVKSNVDESRTVVVDGGAEGSSQAAPIAISSSDDEVVNDEDEDSDEVSEDHEPEEANGRTKAEDSDEEMEDAAERRDDPPAEVAEQADASSEEDDAEPSFGEMLASKHQDMILINDEMQAGSSDAVHTGSNALAMHSGISLATVLTQSLRTNDTNLLESCLHATDIDIIKSTIQRLDSSLAGILLSKLADRLATRPGRYGNLLIWAQWTCVVHGGGMAGRPDVISKLRTLEKVVTQRATPQEYLHLVMGKLTMLEAQLALRRDIQIQQKHRHPQDGANVIYIEGQDNWSSDEDEADQGKPALRKVKKPRKALEDLVNEMNSEDEEEEEEGEGDEEDDDDMPTTNGITYSDSGEDEEDSDDDSISPPKPRGVGLVDDEAEVSDDDSDDEGEDVENDEDEEDDSEEDLDSEMNDFINDDSISVDEDEDDEIDIDTPERPAVKRVKRG